MRLGDGGGGGGGGYEGFASGKTDFSKSLVKKCCSLTYTDFLIIIIIIITIIIMIINLIYIALY